MKKIINEELMILTFNREEKEKANYLLNRLEKYVLSYSDVKENKERRISKIFLTFCNMGFLEIMVEKGEKNYEIYGKN